MGPKHQNQVEQREQSLVEIKRHVFSFAARSESRSRQKEEREREKERSKEERELEKKNRQHEKTNLANFRARSRAQLIFLSFFFFLPRIKTSKSFTIAVVVV